MRGKREPRGITDRAGKTIEGENYTGDPDGVSPAWGGGSAGVPTPAIDQYPTVTIPIDENDDGTDTMDPVAAASKPTRKSTRDTTKARHRFNLKTLANWIAWLVGLARGTRSFKGITVDGTGGADVVTADGRIVASENVVAGGDVHAGNDVIADAAVSAAGDVTAGGSMTSGNRTSKQIWLPGLSFVPRSGTLVWLSKGAIGCNATGNAAGSLSPFLRIGSPAAKVTRIRGYWNAGGHRSLTLFRAPASSNWAAGSDTTVATAVSTTVGFVEVADLSGLTEVANNTQTLWIDVEMQTTDGFYGVLVDFEDAVL